MTRIQARTGFALALACGLGLPLACGLEPSFARHHAVATTAGPQTPRKATPGHTPGAEPAADTTATPEEHGRQPYEATSRRSFEDVEHWKRVFDDPGRDAWQKPERVVRALDLRPGMWVADLGAGTGYFIGHLSAVLGPTGTLLAIDTEPNLLSHLRARAEKEDLANVIPILASPDDPRLPPATVDLVLIVDTFHHLDDRLGYFRRLARSLKPGGRIAVIDWREGDLPLGPPPDHKLPRAQVVEEMNAAGYRLADEPDFLPYQYFLIFAPR